MLSHHNLTQLAEQASQQNCDRLLTFILHSPALDKNDALLRWSSEGKINLVAELLNCWPDLVPVPQIVLNAASMNGHTALLRLLLNKTPPGQCLPEAFRLAAANNHQSTVRLLMRHSLPNIDDEEAIELLGTSPERSLRSFYKAFQKRVR